LRHDTCPACGHKTDVSAKAFSLRCPQCTQPIQLEDFILDHSTDGRLKTMGQVAIAPDCDMTGEVTCGHFHNEGGFNGTLLVYGPVHLDGGSRTEARVSARAFHAVAGASFAGALTVGPRVGLAPSDAHRFPAPAAQAETAPDRDEADPPLPPSIVVIPQAETFRAGSALPRPAPHGAPARQVL
jgi:hypothetical protein